MGIVKQLRRNAGWRDARWQCITDPALLETAADLIERLRGYVEHHEDCDTNQPFKGVEFPPCTCGLTALIKEIEERLPNGKVDESPREG